WGGGVMILAPLMIGLVPTLMTLVLFQITVGLAHLALVVGAQALVATFSTGRGRQRDYGIYTTALAIGQAIGPFVAGVVLDLFGFRSAFAVATIAACAAWIIGVLTVRS